MSNEVQQRHRPGPLKQQNKIHKYGKHRSKGAIEADNKGRVEVKILTKKVKTQLRRFERLNQIKQLRQKKREETFNLKRSIGVSGTPPFLVAIIPLALSENPYDALEVIRDCDESAVVTTSQLGNCHISIPRFRQRFTFIIPQPTSITAVLDAVKVADTLLFLVSVEEAIDDFGELCLSCIFAQGLPTVIPVIQGLEKISLKRRHEVKKDIEKILDRKVPKVKCHGLDTSQDGIAILRQIGTQKLKRLAMRQQRPYLLAEATSFEASNETNSFGTLKVSGYIRSKPLSVSRLIHIVGWGDFQMKQIDSVTDPHSITTRKIKTPMKDDNGIEEDVKILEKVDPSCQESLQSENIPDLMEGEQTWPTEEEIEQAEANFALSNKKIVKQVPRGTSTYQAAWILENKDDIEEKSNDEDGSDFDDIEMKSFDPEETVSDEDNPTSNEEYETLTTTEGEDPEKYDEKMDLDEDEKMLIKCKEDRTDLIFPDEIDTPIDTLAKIRFQRYRGLDSFKTSLWDPMESLPADYARIYQFENFKHIRKKVFLEEYDGALPGWYVTIHIANVPKAIIDFHNASVPLVLFGLLPYEQKMSVLNLVTSRHPSNTDSIKAKEKLIFHIGYRRFAFCPIFSQHTFGNKHKFERFLRSDANTVMTVFAPVMFPPASVLVFKEQKDGSQALISIGSLLNIDPNRIVVKRIVLSGHPFKINKKSAVVRYMFFQKEDILWFKPVQLKTNFGRRGHIREPLGTHGHMKCVFNAQLKAEEVVFMHLYKRVFPKWTYNPNVSQSTSDSIEDECV